MTQIEALAIAAPLVAAAALGLFGLATNYFDDKATAKRQKQKPSDVARQTANTGVSLPELSEAEREQLKLHIETLEAFAETVKNAGAVLEKGSRRVHRADS
ncbi:MAG TPA: hypothetical protein VGO49_14760 [Bradyrhizobium sp.]|jgi:hypothetical protein|nr:hypothetical protein [Bradyrhizobium sp.]